MAIEVILLSVFAALTWGISSFVAGSTSRRLGAQQTAFATQITNLVVIAPLALLLPGRWSPGSAAWGALAALGGAVGFVAIYRAMALGSMGVAVKLQSGLIALVPFVIGVGTGDRPSVGAIGGVGLILLSVTMLAFAPNAKQANEVHAAGSPSEGSSRHRASQLALLSGLCFGVAILPMAQTSTQEGLVPLVSYRIGIVLVLYVLLRSRSGRPQLSRREWGPLAAAGTLSAVGDAAFLTALQMGPLSIVPAITALSPGVTAVLARCLGRDKIRPIQACGIVVGLIGLIVMNF